MGVYIYFDIKINLDLLNNIPNNATTNVSFYLYNYGADPFYWDQRLTDINLKKDGDTIIPRASSNVNYLYDESLTIEQDGEDVYLYKSSSEKPEDPRLFAKTQSAYNANIACSKCDLIYNSGNSCTLVMRLVPVSLKVNIINHISPPNLLVSMPNPSISSITIENDRNNTVLSYTPTKNENTFENTYINIGLNNGVPIVLERNEDDIFLYRANNDKPISSVYKSKFTGSMTRYLSVEKVKFLYVSEYEVDMHIYFASSHGRIVEYYAIYEYTILVPNNINVDDEEEEEEEGED